MSETPHPPRPPTFELEPAEVDHCCAPADGGEITGVPVTERTQRRIAVETPLDGARDIYALLLRNRCNARSGLAIPHIHSDRIADRKNIRMTGNRQIRFDFHSPRAVRVRIQPCPGRRGA